VLSDSFSYGVLRNTIQTAAAADSSKIKSVTVPSSACYRAQLAS